MPLYRQMLQQLRQRIASGQLAAGTQLPSVRDLSQQLHVNPLTVVKVFQLLEREDLVEFRRGLGTFVKPSSPKMSADERRQLLLPSVKQLVMEAQHLRIEAAEVEKMVQEQFKKNATNQRHTHE